jgi:hypothetical protein
VRVALRASACFERRLVFVGTRLFTRKLAAWLIRRARWNAACRCGTGKRAPGEDPARGALRLHACRRGRGGREAFIVPKTLASAVADVVACGDAVIPRKWPRSGRSTLTPRHPGTARNLDRRSGALKRLGRGNRPACGRSEAFGATSCWRQLARSGTIVAEAALPDVTDGSEQCGGLLRVHQAYVLRAVTPLTE